MLSFQQWNGLRQDLSHWSPTVNSSYLSLKVLFELHGTEKYIEKQLQQSIH